MNSKYTLDLESAVALGKFHPDKGFFGTAATLLGYALGGPIARYLKVRFYGSTSSKSFTSRAGGYLAATALCEAFWMSAAIYEHSHIMDKQVIPAAKLLIDSSPCIPEEQIYTVQNSIACKPRNLGTVITPIFGFKAGPYVLHETRYYNRQGLDKQTKCAQSIVSITGCEKKDFLNWFQTSTVCRRGMDSFLAK